LPLVERTALVPYTCAEMFALVNDFENYPDFLPWCSKAELHTSENEQLTATLSISKGFISDSFTTKNTNDPPHSIHMTHLQGPFSHLQGSWSFTPLGDALVGEEKACRIDLKMDFAFSNSLVNLFANSLQNDIAAMMDAFIERAEVIYGPRDI